MSKTTILWAIVLFLGGSILFGSLRRLTEGESGLVVAAVQIGALAIVVIGIVIFVRMQSRE